MHAQGNTKGRVHFPNKKAEKRSKVSIKFWDLLVRSSVQSNEKSDNFSLLQPQVLYRSIARSYTSICNIFWTVSPICTSNSYVYVHLHKQHGTSDWIVHKSTAPRSWYRQKEIFNDFFSFRPCLRDKCFRTIRNSVGFPWNFVFQKKQVRHLLWLWIVNPWFAGDGIWTMVTQVPNLLDSIFADGYMDPFVNFSRI